MINGDTWGNLSYRICWQRTLKLHRATYVILMTTKRILTGVKGNLKLQVSSGKGWNHGPLVFKEARSSTYRTFYYLPILLGRNIVSTIRDMARGSENKELLATSLLLLQNHVGLEMNKASTGLSVVHVFFPGGVNWGSEWDPMKVQVQTCASQNSVHHSTTYIPYIAVIYFFSILWSLSSAPASII